MSGGPDPQVLVVLVNNQDDWQRVVEEHWYRIPLRTAPQPVAASYLAFYQTRIFGADAFRIRYYAPVLRYQRLTRRELLPQEANHPRASQQYYRIGLGALEELARPVPSRRLRRITFIPTTLRRLQEADEINDLWMADDVEDMLWELFRDAGIKAERRLEIGEGRQRYCSCGDSGSSVPAASRTGYFLRSETTTTNYWWLARGTARARHDRRCSRARPGTRARPVADRAIACQIWLLHVLETGVVLCPGMCLATV